MCFASAKNSQRSTTRPSAALAGRPRPPPSPGAPGSTRANKLANAGKRKAGQPHDPAQPPRVLAGDLKPHFLQEVVLLGVRGLKQAHPAAAAERGRARDRARRRGGVDEEPVALLDPPGEHDDDQRDQRQTGRRAASKTGRENRAPAARPSGRARDSPARPSRCAIDGSALARRRSCRCNRPCRGEAAAA